MRRIARAGLAAVVLLALAPAAALAEGPQPTSMRLAVPAGARLGQVAQVQAQLVDASGKPIAGALVAFTAPLGFLQASGDVVLADATTDKGGVATAEIDLRTQGALTVTVLFKGDAQHASSSADATIDVQGSGQLYAQTAGVQLPGLNAEPVVPVGAPQNVALAERTASLWPAMSGWPIALALMIIWSLYASVVVILFQLQASRTVEA